MVQAQPSPSGTMAPMRKMPALGTAILVVACGSAEPPPKAAASAAIEPAPPREPTASATIRTRLPKDTPCGEADVCGFFLQVISPGAEPQQLVDRAMEIVRGRCGGTIIVYRDKRGIMGAGPVFATESEKTACREALGRSPESDDYPTEAVWRKAE